MDQKTLTGSDDVELDIMPNENGDHEKICQFDNNHGANQYVESAGLTHSNSIYSNLPYRSAFVAPSISRMASRNSHLSADDRGSCALSRKRSHFMKSVRNRDVKSVSDQLEEDPNLTMYNDDMGISALSVAVRAGPNLIEPFLKKIKARSDKRRLAIWIEHALLYAISADNYESVDFLLDEREKIIEIEIKSMQNRGVENAHNMNKAKGMTWSDRHKSTHLLVEFEDAEFPVYLTPIVLASKLNRVEIVKLLLERDVSEIHPLTKECPYGGYNPVKQKSDPCNAICEICRERKIFKSKREVEESKRLVEIYKALSSPAYIFNSGVEDPVLELFHLSQEMHNLAIEDAPFKTEYEEICKHCRVFACDLLDLCRSTEELETLLSNRKGIQDVNSCPKNVAFQRILVAVTYGQKEFLTHPACQQVLQRKWYEGLPDWVCETEHRSLFFVFYILLWCFFWPFACILFMLKVCPWVIRFMKHPINKFISDTISFIVFLILLIIECNNNKEEQKAKDIFTPYEICIILWIIGLLARQVKMFFRHRRSNDIAVDTDAMSRGFWRRYDMLLLLCFIIWIVLYVIGVIVMYAQDRENEVRSKWEQGNVILIAEGFFSLGTLLSFVKLVGLFKVSSSLGPLQISLKLMLNDIIRFLFIFFITMTGFVMAITNIYSHYEGHTRVDEEGLTYQMEGLILWRNTYKTLFWSLFGYGDVEVADVVVGNQLEEDGSNSTYPVDDNPEVVKHKVTEAYGYFLFGSYHIIVIIVLINMLIAMMARSYEVIECNSDREWKYARTKLRMLYFSEVGSLPPPFNIFLIGSLMKLLVKLCVKCNSCCRNMYDSDEGPKPHDYTALMDKLGKRYMNRVSQKSKEESGSAFSDEDLLRLSKMIKQSSSFKGTSA